MQWSHEHLDGKRRRRSKWHQWFAWYPVPVGGNHWTTRWAWLVVVWRRVEWRAHGYAMEEGDHLHRFYSVDTSPLQPPGSVYRPAAMDAEETSDGTVS